MNIPGVSKERLVKVERYGDVEKSIRDLKDQAPLPLRKTFTITMQYYIHRRKHVYQRWTDGTKEALGYIPKDMTATCAPLLIAITDGYGTGAVYDLKAIYESEKDKARGVVPELLQLLGDPEMNWIMADVSAGTGVPGRGGPELYWMLLKNWSGKDLCQKLTSTLDLPTASGWSDYANAIEALAPERWQEKWKQVIAARSRREKRAFVDVEAMRDELEQRGVMTFEEMVALESAMENYVWRACLLRGVVNEDMAGELWGTIARLWQEELTISSYQAAEAWRRIYDKAVIGQQVFERLNDRIFVAAGKRAQQLRWKRSKELGHVEPEESIVRTVEELEEQARLFEQILAFEAGAPALSQAMFRQLKARLFDGTRRKYDSLTRMTLRITRNITPPPAKKWKQQEDALSASVKPVETEKAVEARTPVTAKTREKDRGGVVMVPHSGARQRWDGRPLCQPVMSRGEVKSALDRESEGQRHKSGSKHERSPSSSSTQIETSTSDSDTAKTKKKKASGGRREKSRSEHHKTSQYRSKGDSGDRGDKGDRGGPLRSEPVVKRQVEEEKRDDRQSKAKKPERQQTVQQLRELITEMDSKARQLEKEDKERMKKVERLASAIDEVDKPSTSKDDRKRSHYGTGEKYPHRGEVKRRERSEEKRPRSKDRDYR